MDFKNRTVIISFWVAIALVILTIGYLSVPPKAIRMYDECQHEIVDHPKITLLTKLIKAESLSESFEDKLCVGSIVLNRISSKDFPGTMDSVIFQTGQFQSINSKLFVLPPLDSMTRAELDCYMAAKSLILYGSVLPKNFLYFHRKDIKNEWARYLVKTSSKIKMTENHIFYGK